MKFILQAENPNQIEFTLKATMTLAQWRLLSETLGNSGSKSPMYEFRQQINLMVIDAEKTFPEYKAEK